jgi:hypothetical protein
MSDFITGVENDLSKGFQSLESIGTGLLDDVDNVAFHPLSSIERIGSVTMEALRKGASYIEDTAENIYGRLKTDAQQAGTAVRTQVSNLDKVVTSHLPAHHTSLQPVSELKQSPISLTHIEQVQEVKPEVVKAVVKPEVVKTVRKRSLLKKLVNWVILLLVLVLIGVIVYLTCKRYSLVGSAIDKGDNLMAAALLTPELSAGLSTLAAVL